jgi:membrane protease YdiL (CAAX protease family)
MNANREGLLSIKIYFGLIMLLALLVFAGTFLPMGTMIPTQEITISPLSRALLSAGIALVVYGGLGFVGLVLTKKLGFADIWDERISIKQRFVIPAAVGAACGVFLVIADMVFSGLHPLGSLPHPPFPASLVASAAAGIGEELIFRLFFVSFWMWLVSTVIPKKRWRNQVFWAVAIFSALAFAAGHIPAVLIFYGFETVAQIPPALMAEIFLLNAVISLFAAYYFRKFGFLAAVGIHFWADIIWHVIWGLLR